MSVSSPITAYACWIGPVIVHIREAEAEWVSDEARPQAAERVRTSTIVSNASCTLVGRVRSLPCPFPRSDTGDVVALASTAIYSVVQNERQRRSFMIPAWPSSSFYEVSTLAAIGPFAQPSSHAK